MASRYEQAAKPRGTQDTWDRQQRAPLAQRGRFATSARGGWTNEPAYQGSAAHFDSYDRHYGAYDRSWPQAEPVAQVRLGRWTRWGLTLSVMGWLTIASSCSPLVTGVLQPRPTWNDALARAQSALALAESRKQEGDPRQLAAVQYSSSQALRPIVALERTPPIPSLDSNDTLPRFARRADGTSSGDVLSANAASRTDFVVHNDRQDVQALLAQARQDVAGARAGLGVKPIFFDGLPYNLSDMTDLEARKQVFIGIVLPLALSVNAEIQAERDQLLALGYEGPIENTGDPWLQALAEKYYEQDGTVESLLEKVAPLPVDMVLAQAIEETGWGTSRFALKINALFGQRVWNDEADGLIPYRRDEDESFKVRGFESLRESIASYALNLNRHHKYADMRYQRQVIMEESAQPSGTELMPHLQAYSTERDKYIRNIKRLIKENRLDQFNTAELLGGQDAWYISFDRSSLEIILAELAAKQQA